MPCVSVIMSAYNAERYIDEAVRSVIDQSMDNWEMIVCDDGSTDGTWQLMKNAALSDTRIRLIQNENNRGLAYSLNRCLEECGGEYIGRMDADDISHPDRLERQVAILDEHKEYALCGGGMNYFDETGIWGRELRPEQPGVTDVFRHKGFFHGTILMRANVLRNIGAYTVSDITLRTEDYDLWCKFYKAGHVGYNIQDIVYDARVDRDAFARRKFKYRLDEMKLRRYWYNELELPGGYRKHIIKPLIAGLVPAPVMKAYHKKARKAKVDGEN